MKLIHAFVIEGNEAATGVGFETRKRRTTMRKLTILSILVALVAVAPAGAERAQAGFAHLLGPYEAVRQALVADDLSAAHAPAATLGKAAAHLRSNLTAESAGVATDKLAEVEGLLPGIERAAGTLAAAADLQVARDAFYDLSKLLVQWRQAAGDGPVVLYCPMKKRSWLQPSAQPVGNPYLGKAMASCGQVVSK